MDITVFGMGYCGLCHGRMLGGHGSFGKRVDLQETKMSLFTQEKSPVIEPDLGDLILRDVDAGRLRATQRVQRLGDISLICVGTPSNVLSRLGSLAHG